MNFSPRLRKKPGYNERKRWMSSKQNANTTISTGRFNGFCVIIDKLEDIQNVHFNGFYGKANFSRSYPSNETNSAQINIQMANGEHGSKYCNGIVTEPSDLNTEPLQYLSVQETLNLMLEEAFYLMGHLNRLEIYYNDKLLNVDETWKLFIETQDNFVQNYIVYYYFRTRNWVLKCGLKYGGDFLVYKEGPPFYHSSYLIIVDVLFKNTLERNKNICKRSLNWKNLFGLYRMGEAAAKDILICQVLWPDDLTVEDMKSSKELFKLCSVKPVIMQRWCAKEERTVVH